MAKFKLDFSLDAWIRNLEVEAESEEEAINELYKMSIETIMSEGYVKDFETKNIDVEVISKSYKVEVTVEEWDGADVDTEDSVEVARFESLPSVVTLTLDDIKPDAVLDDAIEEELEYEFDFTPKKYVVKVLQEY